MNIDYIIVQAGGKGTRLEQLTKNKPKTLVPIQNLPMIFHLFKKFPDKKFIIIGDYKIDVLKKYLDVFSEVHYIIVDASEHKGTCAGIHKAIDYIPENNNFMLIWSDLVLQNQFALPTDSNNYIGLSKDFLCRWKYENEEFLEEASSEFGVAGMFIFQDKHMLQDVPLSGEFVRWLQEKQFGFREVSLRGTKEFGLLEDYNSLKVQKCRPFNKLTIIDDKIIKEGIDDQGKKLAVLEKAWYRHVKDLGYNKIPTIYSFEPFTMQRIEGQNIYQDSFNENEKIVILNKLVDNLKVLHSYEVMPSDYFSIKENYFNKTMKRLVKVRDLIPFANEKEIVINGRKCRNVFFYRDILEKRIDDLTMGTFCLIHGDCTFSNMMLDSEGTPILIDPRGYFGFTQLYGDPRYDWAKLYYSISGDYDQFNLKNFSLYINENDVELKIGTNGWRDMEEEFLKLIQNEISEKEIKTIHAIIWLSLTTYAWEDYDSICAAFYNGLYYLEEVL